MCGLCWGFGDERKVMECRADSAAQESHCFSRLHGKKDDNIGFITNSLSDIALSHCLSRFFTYITTSALPPENRMPSKLRLGHAP